MKRSGLCAAIVALGMVLSGSAFAADAVTTSECNWGGFSSGPSQLYLQSRSESACTQPGGLSVSGAIQPVNPFDRGMSTASAQVSGTYVLAAPATRLTVVSTVDLNGWATGSFLALGYWFVRVSVTTSVRIPGCPACHVSVTRDAIDTSLGLSERTAARIVTTAVATNTDAAGALIPAGDVQVSVGIEGYGEANGVLASASYNATATVVKVTANPIS